MRGQPDQRHPGDQAQPGRDQRHPRRGERAEREQQDEQGGDHADLCRRADVESLRRLDDLPAGRDLQAGNADTVDQLQQRLARGRRQLVRGPVVVDRRKRRHAVPRDLHGSARAVRADDSRDVRERAHARQHRRDRGAHGRRVDRSPRDVEDDRVRVAALRRELLRKQIVGPLGVRSRKAVDGDVVRPDHVGDDRRADRDDHPRDDDTSAVSHAPAGQTAHPPDEASS